MSDYIHGFTPEEQERLHKQAQILKNILYEGLDLSPYRNLIEVGCGVGAQTEILLDKWPELRVTGIDASKSNLLRAEELLKTQVSDGRVKLMVADAMKLPFADNHFDSAFLCWFLEHVSSPKQALSEVRRVLQPKGRIFCTEVQNASFFIHPYSPATLQYWFEFNDHQWSLAGDPFVGAKLGNLLLSVGFQNVETTVKTFHFDSRTPKTRAQFIEYWTELLLSGVDGMKKAGRVTDESVAQMRVELDKLKNDPEAVFFYSFIQATAQAF